MKLKTTVVSALALSALWVAGCSSKATKADETLMGSTGTESAAPAATYTPASTPVAASEPANLGKASSGQGR